MFCKNCGKEADENQAFCNNCGAPLQQGYDDRQAPAPARQNYSAPNAPADGGGFGWGVLGFFFPVVGLILFLVWKDSLPLRSKSCGKGALVGVIVEVIFIIITVIVTACTAALAMYSGVSSPIL